MSKPKAKLLCRILQMEYPKVFCFDDPVPLAVGMNREVKQAYPELSGKIISRCLHFWCGRREYIRRIAESKPGAKRFHLDGSPGGLLTASDRRYAKEQLESLSITCE